MMRVKLIVLGKCKEKYLKAASDEYTKRLSRYCRLEIVETQPVKLPENPSIAQINSALEREADEILKKIPEGCEIFSLCIEGEQMSSDAFAKRLKHAENAGKTVAFIIGSSYGLAEKIKDKADYKLSFSQMTFPHQLFRVMLLEQIYRAFKINEGSAYHK